MSATPPRDVLELVPNVDVTRLPLSAHEGFVFSRIDGKTALQDLVAATGLPEDVVRASVEHLMKLGAIRRTASAASASIDDGPPEELTELEESEKCDLTEEQRLRIVQAEWFAINNRHYELLGVRRSIPHAELKPAFFERSKDFHPDTYFRKELGSFKPRLERTFRQLKISYELLSDPHKRNEYDAQRAKEDAAAGPRQPARADWMNDPRRLKEAEERRLRRNPMIQRVQRARRHYDRARELFEQKHYGQAANELGLASAQDPQNAEIRDLLGKVTIKQREEKLEKLVTRVMLLSAGNDIDEPALAQAVKEAVDMEMETAAPYLRMAKAVLAKGLFKVARPAADRASKLAPDDPKVLAMMADLYEQAGITALLTKTLERLITLAPDPKHEERLKKLKGVKK